MTKFNLNKIKNKIKTLDFTGSANLLNLMTVSLVFLLTFSLTYYFISESSINDQIDMTNHENTLIAEQKFIDKVAPYIQKRQKKDGILASITIAQMILESDWGKSSLASKYHNYFGVKSTSDDAKKTVKIDTQEYVNGQWVTVKGTFAVYKNWQESVYQHNRLFLKGTTWNKKQYKDVIHAKNYTDGTKALVKNAYATDPDYAKKIIRLVERYHLDIYD